MDVKHLSESSDYFAQMKALGVPAFQYTIRELSIGAQFLAYSQELSKIYATQGMKCLLEYLTRFYIDIREVVGQTLIWEPNFMEIIPFIRGQRTSIG